MTAIHELAEKAPAQMPIDRGEHFTEGTFCKECRSVPPSTADISARVFAAANGRNVKSDMKAALSDDLVPSAQRLLKRFDETCIDSNPDDLLEVLFVTLCREYVRILPTFEAFMAHVEDTRRRLERRGREVFREPDIKGLN